MTYEVITKNGELYHHGIAGQKWGVQNGPPYPLKETVHDKIVKKAKTEEGRTGAEIGKKVGQIRSAVTIGVNAPAAVALVASVAAINPPLAVAYAAGMAGGAFVGYKLNTIGDAFIGRVIGDQVGKSNAKK